MVLTELWFWGVVFLVAALMEVWAMLLHGCFWHRILWWGHASHHRSRHGPFELNDIFSVGHAVIAIALIVYGLEAGPGMANQMMVAIGFGMTGFGVCYFVVHDGYIHGRLPVGFLHRFAYMRRIRSAHVYHHSFDHVGPYGLFLGPWELARQKRLRRRVRRSGPMSASVR